MEVTIDRGALVRALDPVVKASGGPKSPHVALRCVRLTSDADGVKLAATRYDQQATSRVDGAVKGGGGDVIVEAGLLHAAVRKMGGPDVKLATRDRALAITAGRTSMRLPASPGTDHPDLIAPAESAWFKVPREALREALAASYGAENDPSRPQVACVLLEARGHELRGVAMRNTGIVLHTQRLEHAIGTWRAPVPLAALSLLDDACAEGDVEMAIEGQLYVRRSGGLVVGTKLLDDAFPKYDEAIAHFTEKACSIARAPRRDLAEAMERAQLVLTPDQSIVVRVAEGSLQLSAKTDRGDVDDAIAVDLEGESVGAISFGVGPLRDAFTKIAGDEIVLSFGPTQIDAVIVRDADGARVNLVMPRNPEPTHVR